jgi:hypothetical protein
MLSNSIQLHFLIGLCYEVAEANFTFRPDQPVSTLCLGIGKAWIAPHFHNLFTIHVFDTSAQGDDITLTNTSVSETKCSLNYRTVCI